MATLKLVLDEVQWCAGIVVFSWGNLGWWFNGMEDLRAATLMVNGIGLCVIARILRKRDEERQQRNGYEVRA
jgi:hypothetical protein